MDIITPVVVLPAADFERIEQVLRVFGLSVQSTPDTASKVVEALKLEGRAEANVAVQSALGILERLQLYSSGLRSGNKEDAAAYLDAAIQAEADGRRLYAAAARATALVNNLLIALDEQNKAGKERADHLYRMIEQHQGAASEMGMIINEANVQLDKLGVSRLPAPLDRSVALRIKVLADMRQRVATAPVSDEARPRPVHTVGGYAACIHCSNTDLGIDRLCGKCGKHPFQPAT